MQLVPSRRFATSIDDQTIREILRGPGIYIAGIEVTQGIQYHDAAAHLTDPADRDADNAVTLVAGKVAWVRVYVRSSIFRGDISGVTGTLEVKRRTGGFLYAPIATLAPQAPGSVTAHESPVYKVERSTLGSTLNFIVSADDMCGELLFRATVNAAGDTDVHEAHVDVTLHQTLRLRGVMVGYKGPKSTAPGAPTLTLAPPTITDLQTTSQWALLTFPVDSVAEYSSAGSITLTVPLSDAPPVPGGCTPNWGTLNAKVAVQATADGNRTDVLYYGLIATGVPMGPIVGCESSGVSAGGAGDGVALAHELGHHCGFPHAPCGAVGTPDATYPAYEPYDPKNTPNASIGEYGIDVSNGNIMSPASFKDMMSYCGPKWISLHNYGKLLNHPKLDPKLRCVDHPWWEDMILYERTPFPEKWLPDPPPGPDWYFSEVSLERFISIIGVMRSDRELEVTSVMRVETRPGTFGTPSGELTAELVSAGGQRLASAPVRELSSQACGCGGGGGTVGVGGGFPRVVQALIADIEPGGRLAIRRGEDELWARLAPSRPPEVEFEAAVEEDSLSVSWRVDAECEAPELWLQWSADHGETWQALATDLAGSRATLDASHLPAGRILLRLLAGDGFHSTYSELVQVTLPHRSPAVGILTPRAGQTIVAGGPQRLWAAVTPAARGIEARWLMDDEPVGDGLDTFVTAPPAGEHRLRLEIVCGGQTTTASSSFVTVDAVPRHRRKSSGEGDEVEDDD